jgi:sulfate adenylyltransferase subunit 2
MTNKTSKMSNINDKIGQFPRRLEDESIYIMREVAAQFERPALLFSGGKDSITLVRLAQKAFYPGKIPFPLVHIDTGHNFPETIEFRDWLAKETGADLIVRYVQDSIDQGKAKEETGKYASRNVLQTVTLLDTIEEFKFDACIGGARRDEEKARPELFDMLNGRIAVGENVRVFPISNWTELDVWNYIKEEKMEIPSIYFAHKREVIERDGMLWADSEFLNKDAEEIPFETTVRFRTVGDMTCTAAVSSEAADLDTIIEEILAAEISERGARIDDKRSEAAMEKRKQQGYF